MALYSRKDLTREKYAVSLSFSGQPFRLRLRKDNLEFALDVMTSMCFVHSKSSLTVTLLRVTSEYHSFHYMILQDHIHSSVSSEI